MPLIESKDKQQVLFINPDNDQESSRIKQEMELLLFHFIVIYCNNILHDF